MIHALTLKRHARSLLALLGAILFFAHAEAHACNIPVFRYALERWQADLLEVLVIHDDVLASGDHNVIERLQKQSRAHGGTANIQVIPRHIDQVKDETLLKLWESALNEGGQPLPLVQIRSRVGQGKQQVLWQGWLDDKNEVTLLDSPARTELVSRLLGGDSVVWVVMNSPNAKDGPDVVEMLQSTLPEIAKEIPIPEGIGLPGSELFSPLPLDIHFSVLEVDTSDPQEEFLVQSMSRLAPDVDLNDTSLVIPVFGRGRALDVFTPESLRPSLVRELSIFLSSACSCQVKDLNPGFDLLIKANWQLELFGEEPPEIPIAESPRHNKTSEAILVPIPKGLKLDDPSQNDFSSTQVRAASPASVEPQPVDIRNYRLSWLILMFLSLVVVVVLVSGATTQKQSPSR